MNLNLSLEEVRKLSENYNVIPLYTELLVDTETPLSIFLKLKEKGQFNILLESAEGGEKWGRYSFIITGSSFYLRTRKDIGEIYERGKVNFFETKDPLSKIKEVVKKFIPYHDERLPRFWGGLVGYFAYDVVKFYEPVEDKNPDPIHTYDIYLVLTDVVVIHDNLTGKIKVVVPIFAQNGIEEEYERAKNLIRDTVKKLKERGTTFLNVVEKEPDFKNWRSNFTKEEFEDIVKKAKEYIAQGDVIQVVLSQRFRKRFKGNPDNIYRVLRFLNPSPYMYYLDFDQLKVIGSSPEILVRLEEGRIETRPIAGTRKRGRTEEEDKRLEEDLLSDEKERAEHLMLVDLARNDIGRVAKTGSVRVENFMRIERYSHVMHIVSDVVGELREGYDALDVLKATFPAGTVSGAPKVRAMQIIEELENERRGIYAGSVGYISFQGNMDMAIAIRTAVYRDRDIFVQAGAGIVADSVPEKEWEETVNKAKALMKAIEIAEESQEE
ncbi:anthranilate synthase component I [Aquifex aeolicus]|uniref:Anthranilate synthase component 1 n=1 Tax=Aquifex aeolicus (strain VF5) TaxID=224324 RepID=TRPE_AQUAE|nr:anthranilate synthase component I [Aquifex aeolicus]O66849.1 RecName: Full=Anthranilate synthase component 1; Short=AS; Short=ASI [Aquifex aeolicus VF5]AAC06796.1 anthranilate synthase component I [Aquifex aeolicus VF5]